MIRTFFALLIPALTLMTTSCGCKKGPKVPTLRPLPGFQHPSDMYQQESSSIDEMLDQVKAKILGSKDTGEMDVIEQPKIIKEK